jgi:hypothetical protein
MNKETLDEATERILEENYAYKDDSGDRVYYDTQVKQCIIDGAKLKEERSYSENDMIDFLNWSKSTNKEKSEYELKCLLNGKDIDSKKLFIMWFEQFKKK